MLEDYYKPFEDFDNVGVKKTFTRVFRESVKKEQLLWHKDRKDRKNYSSNGKLIRDIFHFC